MPLSSPGRLSDQVKTLETGSAYAHYLNRVVADFSWCRISDFDFSPFSDHLVTAGEDSRIRLWPLSEDIYKVMILVWCSSADSVFRELTISALHLRSCQAITGR